MISDYYDQLTEAEIEHEQALLNGAWRPDGFAMSPYEQFELLAQVNKAQGKEGLRFADMDAMREKLQEMNRDLMRIVRGG